MVPNEEFNILIHFEPPMRGQPLYKAWFLSGGMGTFAPPWK